ncbi:MAG TPA: integrase arm-type DNA-binding domain-containing protein [Bryobacteraceae bacterium]|nr:integrase arm-type DNA-binding domain-containing protein [Bryobacteraceae bacterium]
MALTQFAIVNAAAKDRPLKLSDGGGLHLFVTPGGSKLWRFRYRFLGRENTLSFGSFPTVPLGQAREKRNEARRLLAEGKDPAAKKRLDRIAAASASRNTFGAVAAEYIERLQDEGASESTIAKNRWLLEDLAASFAKRPITEIYPAEILLVLKRIEKSGRRETARRLRGVMGAVFRFAIVTLRATNDPTFALRGALLKPAVNHRAAITEEEPFGRLMVAIDEYDGWPTLRVALQLLALTMTRPGDVRHMRRSEVSFSKATWRIPAERMKMRRPHDVPLSRQSLTILRDIWPLSEGSDLVLPSVRSRAKPLSENAMNSALRRLGYTKDEMTAHGFRSAASTILNERGFNRDVIEAALAHQDEDEIRRIYNRAKYWPERINLLQDWADLIDEWKRTSFRKFRAA